MNNGRAIHPVVKFYWKSTWSVVTPAILTVLLVMSLLSNLNTQVEHEGYVYPVGVQALGCLITACTLVWIPVFACLELWRAEGGHRVDLLRPTQEWGRQKTLDVL